MKRQRPKPIVTTTEEGKEKDKEKEEEQQHNISLYRSLRSIAKPRQLSRTQNEVLILSVMRCNLMMSGPNGAGKKWIARYVVNVLTLLGLRVEVLVGKAFTVSAAGHLWIDSAILPLAMKQLVEASVIVVEDVPSHPAAAQAFFAYLDFLARVVRCQSGGNGNKKDENEQKEKKKEEFGESPEQVPFGALQIIATQVITPPVAPVVTSSTETHLSTNKPHDAIFVIEFR